MKLLSSVRLWMLRCINASDAKGRVTIKKS